MDDDKVSVSIREIENGYIVERSWCEKKDGKDGQNNYDYHHESYYLGSLPPVLQKMFSKGKNAQDMGGKPPEDEDDEFEKSIKDMGGEGGDKEDKPDENDSEE
jgi:hypothetical protein